MIELIKREFHGKTIFLNNQYNQEGKKDLEICIFDNNGETEKGFFFYHFPVKSAISFMFSEKSGDIKENVFLRLYRFKPLLFDVTEIRYRTQAKETIIGSYIDKERQAKLFDDHFIFRTEYFKSGQVTMKNTVENINFAAEIIENKEGKRIKESTFQKVLIKYLETFLITENFQPNQDFNHFYKQLKFI